jgi:hypothetical protein
MTDDRRQTTDKRSVGGDNGLPSSVVCPPSSFTASDPADKGLMFEPTASKSYRHPTFYDVPDEVGHM